MKKTRLEIIPTDIQGQILLNLNHDDIIKACQLREFNIICNSEYFWKNYAQKYNIKKISDTWKLSVKLFPILDFLEDFAPNYVGSIGVYPIKGEVEETAIKDINEERYNYLKNKGYRLKYNRNYEEYYFYKPFNKYLEDKNIIVPYSKVILVSREVVEKDNWTNNLSTNTVHKRLRYLLQPPLSSKPYIILEKDKVIIDSKIKGSPIIAEDILFASRAFMKHYTSSIPNIEFLEEKDDVLILKVSIYDLPTH